VARSDVFVGLSVYFSSGLYGKNRWYKARIKGFCTYESRSAFSVASCGLKVRWLFVGCGGGDVDGILAAGKFNKKSIAGKT
jgi:hypothetical protein